MLGCDGQRWNRRRLCALLAGAASGTLGVTSRARAEETHTVQAGDTLASLADLHGVTEEDLAAANGLAPGDSVFEGQELEMPHRGDDGNGESSSGTTPVAIVENIPAYQQSRSLSCEYASVYIATSAFGAPIEEQEYIAVTPQAANPHFGYRGNIDGVWGITDDYGIYAEALTPVLEAHGYVAEVSYGADAALLQAHLDAGHPTIVWIATRGDTGFYETDETGTFKLVPYEHVVVAYGYDADVVYISDPGNGSYTTYDWTWFLDAWDVLDGMALAVYPA